MGNHGKIAGNSKICIGIQSQLILSEFRNHKIPKISPGAYIFLRPFLRGLFFEELIYGGKFAFRNRLG